MKGNEIWFVNRISQEKCFRSKIMQKNEAGTLAPDLFWFFKKP